MEAGKAHTQFCFANVIILIQTPIWKLPCLCVPKTTGKAREPKRNVDLVRLLEKT